MVDFSNTIINWYKHNLRDLPWRQTKDPYRIWLSEIILQQTQVSQGLPYYKRFVKAYPTVFDLAEASEDEILKLWQGLGYYSRARNLHYTSKIIVEKYNGVFPDNYKTLKTLKGIGDYTASAIASICFKEPVAVLDGNVFRVFSRLLGIDTPINTTEGKKIFKLKTAEFLDKKNPDLYNQAVMEFGALHCKPKKPLCDSCPFQTECVAFQQGKVDKLPVKLKKLKVKKRYFNYIVFLLPDNKTVIQKRIQKDIWRNLYEFPLVESTKTLNKTQLLSHPELNQFEFDKSNVTRFYPKPIKHQLTHQQLFIDFWIVQIKRISSQKIGEEAQFINRNEVEKLPVSSVIEFFLNTFDF